MKAKILVVEDDVRLRMFCLTNQSRRRPSADAVGLPKKQLNCSKGKFRVILTDVNLPGKSGLELLPIVRQHNPNVYAAVITGFGTIDTAVQAMKLGASDFLCKPISLNDLISAIRVAVKESENPRQKQ